MPRRSLRAARFALTFKKIMQIVAIGKPLFENRTELPEAIGAAANDDDVVLVLGAGSIGQLPHQLVESAHS
mgnify:CR=1 FL=1